MNIVLSLRREGADQVKDELEEKLLKELNLEFNVQDLYRRVSKAMQCCIMQAMQLYCAVASLLVF